VLEVEMGGQSFSWELPLAISPVEEMYARASIRAETPAVVPPVNVRAGRPAEPRAFVFVHGYNVNEQAARGRQAEMFKRMHRSGSRARFFGVTWFGDDGQKTIPFLGSRTPDYHGNVINALEHAERLKSVLAASVGGNITLAAHSLGNMIAAEAIRRGASTRRFFMLNAAVAAPCFAPEAWRPVSAPLSRLQPFPPLRYRVPSCLMQFDLHLQRLPEGYLALPLAGGGGYSLPVCVVARRKPDPIGGPLVVIRPLPDGQVVLGCIQDQGGQIWQWLEIWVQSIGALQDTLAAYRESLPNGELDARWTKLAETLLAEPEAALFAIGSESRHAPPMWVDLAQNAVVTLTDPGSGEAFELCRDDALLERHGLPAYRVSSHRYLHRPASPETPSFVPVTPGAPENEHTAALAQINRGLDGLPALNPEGGLLLIRPLHPLGYEEFLGVLAGAEWQGLPHGRAQLDPSNVGAEIGSPDSQGRLFLGREHPRRMLGETFHLKLRAFADVLTQTRNAVQRLQRPFFNLAEESFRVRLGEPGRGLPFLWTARVVLSQTGSAVRLPIPGSKANYFLIPDPDRLTVYRPAELGGGRRGQGAFRLRELNEQVQGGCLVHGTLQVGDAGLPGPQELVWLRVSVGNRTFDFHGHLEEDRALARGEARFRSIELEFSEPDRARLKDAAGVPLANARWESIPLLSTPCDLYALAVLGARTFLVNGDNTLPLAMDELQSLARQVATATDLEAGLRQALAQDARWLASLGPQRLLKSGLGVADALAGVPIELWSATLAMLIRMLPGAGPHAACKHLNDARPGLYHEVFTRAVSDVTDLVRGTRGLVVSDWEMNQEVVHLIEELEKRSRS
jgi:hypothetical protein